MNVKIIAIAVVGIFASGGFASLVYNTYIKKEVTVNSVFVESEKSKQDRIDMCVIGVQRHGMNKDEAVKFCNK